jgi:hypothetical protein
MPNEEKLAYEITMARNDLEQNIAELKQAVTDELDLGKQAHRVVEVVKEKAAKIADEQSFKARLWFGQKQREIEAYVRANPAKAAAIGAGGIAGLVGLIWLARRLGD